MGRRYHLVAHSDAVTASPRTYQMAAHSNAATTTPREYQLIGFNDDLTDALANKWWAIMEVETDPASSSASIYVSSDAVTWTAYTRLPNPTLVKCRSQIQWLGDRLAFFGNVGSDPDTGGTMAHITDLNPSGTSITSDNVTGLWRFASGTNGGAINTDSGIHWDNTNQILVETVLSTGPKTYRTSTDKGRTLTSRSLPGGEENIRIVKAGTRWLAWAGGVFYRTDEAEPATWTSVTPVFTNITGGGGVQAHIWSDGALFWGFHNATDGGLIYSSDGISWTRVLSPAQLMSGANTFRHEGFAYNAATNTRMFACTGPSGGEVDARLFKSTDGGVNWTDISPAASLLWRAVFYHNGTWVAVYEVSGDHHWYVSTNEGATWTLTTPPWSIAGILAKLRIGFSGA